MLNFASYYELNPEIKDVTSSLWRMAARQDNPFASFALGWMGFCGWMSCISAQDTDAAMLNDVASNARLSEAFEDMFDEEAFKRIASQFSAMWPVFDSKDVRRKLDHDAFWNLSDEDFIEACTAERVRQQPERWRVGARPSWEQTIRVVYRVRCNMFHGRKSPRNQRDRELVRSANDVLRAFVDGSECMHWH